MNNALGTLLQLAGMKPSGDEISSAEVHEAVDKIKQMLMKLKMAADSQSNGHAAIPDPARAGKHQNVLIAGQLGIVLHQLRQAISKLGGEVTIAKDVDDAIQQYQKKDFSLVIIDLFMPTEREGLIVLEEIKKLSVVCHIPTQLIVLAPSSKDKQIKERCKLKGATFFLEKMEGWHKTIIKYFEGEIDADQFEQQQAK